MRNSTILIYFSLVSFLFSCKNDTKETNSTQPVLRNDNQHKEEVQDEAINLKIDIKDVKQQVDDVTTSFLSRKDTEIFIEKKSKNFFGVYYLIKDDPSNVVGKMIVYDEINPYKYDKDTDEFIEINLWEKGIKLFNDSIEIGMSKEILLKNLGSKFQIEDDILIFNDEPIKGFFKIKDGLITNIKIGLYREDVDNKEILKYEW